MKYPDSVVNEVRDLYKQGKSTREIAKLKGLGKSTVASMIREVEKVGKVKEVPKAPKVSKVRKVSKYQRYQKYHWVLPVNLVKKIKLKAVTEEKPLRDTIEELLTKALK